MNGLPRRRQYAAIRNDLDGALKATQRWRPERFDALLTGRGRAPMRRINSGLQVRVVRGLEIQAAVQPPSATSTVPLTKLASSLARNTAALAISTGSAVRMFVDRVELRVAYPR
jgi:hypothetical protein